MDLIFQKFTEAHYPTYQAWYKDADLQKQLGLMEEDPQKEEWLHIRCNSLKYNGCLCRNNLNK